MENLKQVVRSWYPCLHSQTYCVPPVYMNRVPYSRQSIAGQSVLVVQPPGQQAPSQPPPHAAQGPPPQSPQSMWSAEPNPQAKPAQVVKSNTRDDFAQQHVLCCLQRLGEVRKEPMFIISQLYYGSYLLNPCYEAAVAATGIQLPKPEDLGQQYRRGDFDVLIIHRQYGVLIGEIKAVGLNAADLKKTQAESDADVAKRVKTAVGQLDRSETLMRHLVSDVAPGVSVRKSLILPYVSGSQLLRVLSADTNLAQAVCGSVGAVDVATAVQLCVCTDQLSDRTSPWDVSHTVLTEIGQWWDRRMACTSNTHLSGDVYLELVARFCGPATSVSVHCTLSPRMDMKTMWEALADIGERLARLVLTPTQLDLVTRAPPLVCLTGPPGTGKSVVLVIMALVWLRDGHDVHVLSLRPGSLAMALLMCHQLRMTLKSDRGSFVKAGRVRFHYFDLVNQLEDVEKVLETLVSASQESEELHVIMDEAEFAFQPDRKAHYLVTQLFLRVLRLSLWAAQVGTSYIPAELQVEQVTVPLRCAPTVLREVAPAVTRYDNIPSYTDSGTPCPCDGPRVIGLRHQGEGHSGLWPVDCVQCGWDVASVLNDLRVGVEVTPTNCTLPPNHKNTTKTPALRYRDVIVVTRSSDLHDEVKDDRGQVTSQASGFVLGLRASGIPVAVVTFLKGGQDVEDWKRVVTDVALAESDVVTVADCGVVLGLERKLVVCLPGRRMGYDDKRSDRQVRQRERLTAMSRCSTQLVVISLPGDGDDDEVDDAEDHGGDDGDDDDDNGGDDNDDDDDEDNDNGDDDSDPVNPRQS